MRKKIVIDDRLMRDTPRANGLKTKREAVEQGLADCAALEQTGGDPPRSRQAALAG
ncbi:MAG TPA: type II toxin-antitoxin system VapB family antitoxin [Bryobacteraceae bacterium]